MFQNLVLNRSFCRTSFVVLQHSEDPARRCENVSVLEAVGEKKTYVVPFFSVMTFVHSSLNQGTLGCFSEAF